MNSFFYLYRESKHELAAARLIELIVRGGGVVMASKARAIVGLHSYYKARVKVWQKEDEFGVKLFSLTDSELKAVVPVSIEENGSKWRVSWQPK